MLADGIGCSIFSDAYAMRTRRYPPPIIQPSDVHTLTEFKRNSTELLGRLEESGRPQVLTVEGRPKAILLGVAAFERMAELADRAETIEGIRRGLLDVDAGRTMPLEELEAAVRKRLGLGQKE